MIKREWVAIHDAILFGQLGVGQAGLSNSTVLTSRRATLPHVVVQNLPLTEAYP